MSRRYLITGVIGSGKSTICKELKRRGLHSIDTDSFKGLSAWFNLKTGKPNFELDIKSGEDWIGKYDWMWDKDRFQQMLKENDPQDTFYCGSSANQGDFYQNFNGLFLLEIDAKTLKKRVMSRKEHSFGKKPGELEEIYSYHKWFEDQIAKAGATVIDSTKPIEEIVDIILKETNG